MIVRVLEDRQYELDESQEQAIVGLDRALEAAVEADDDAAFKRALSAAISAARAGKPLDPGTLAPSDLVLPPEDASVEEVRKLLESETVEL